MEDELIESSMGCDDLLRQAFKRRQLNKEARKALDGSNESLDRYFMELLLTQRHKMTLDICKSWQHQVRF